MVFIITGLVYALSLVVLFDLNLIREERPKSRKRILFWLFSLVLGFSYLKLGFEQNKVFVSVSMIFLEVMIALLFYFCEKIPFIKIVRAFLKVLLISVTGDIIVLLFIYITGIDISKGDPASGGRMGAVLMSNTAQIFLAYLFYRRRQKRSQKQKEQNQETLLIGCWFGVMFISFFAQKFQAMHVYYMLLVQVIFVAGCIGYLIYYEVHENGFRKKKELLREMEQLNEQMIQEYHILETQNTRLRRLQHDFRNMQQTVNGLMESGETKKAEVLLLQMKTLVEEVRQGEKQ